MKKLLVLAALLFVGLGYSQTYRISTVGESKQFVIEDVTNGVRERPYLNREVLADTTSQGNINIYRQLAVDYLKPIGFPKVAGRAYTEFVDGNNSDATFASSAAVLTWFADNTGFNSASGGSEAGGDGSVKYKADDYTALSALSSPSTGDIAIVTDDGIGGTFIYDSTKSATDNGGTIIDGWVRQWDGITLVLEWFEVDENAADNKAAINKALALKPRILKGDSDKVYTITSFVSTGIFETMKWEGINLEFDYSSSATQGVWLGTFGDFYLENCNFTSTTAANIYSHFVFEDGDRVVVNNSSFKGASNSFIETTRVRYETRYTNSRFEDSTTHGISQVEDTFVPYKTVVDKCEFKDIKIYGADIHSIHSTISNSVFNNVAAVGKNQRNQSNALAEDPNERTTHTLKNLVFNFDYETALHDIITTSNVAAFGCGADIYVADGIIANIVQPPKVDSGDMRYFNGNMGEMSVNNVNVTITAGAINTAPSDLFYLTSATKLLKITNSYFNLNGLMHDFLWSSAVVHANVIFKNNVIKVGAATTVFGDLDIFYDGFDATYMTVEGNFIEKNVSNAKDLHFLDFPSGANIANLTISNNIAVNTATDSKAGVTTFKGVNNIGITNGPLVRSVTSSRNIAASDIENTLACTTTATLTITADFTSMAIGQSINIEARGVVFTITAASGVTLNGVSAGSKTKDGTVEWTGGILTKTGANSYGLF